MFSQGCLSGRPGRDWQLAGLAFRRRRGVAQLGSAPALGAGGREFESPLPDARAAVRPLNQAAIGPPSGPRQRGRALDVSDTRLHLAYNLIAYAATVVGFWAVRRSRLGMAR